MFEAGHQSRKRERVVEYQNEAAKKNFAVRRDTPEAQVFFSLQGKSATVVAMRKQFLKDFQEKGFGFVEGTKWRSHLSKEEHVAAELYMTRAQILKAE